MLQALTKNPPYKLIHTDSPKTKRHLKTKTVTKLDLQDTNIPTIYLGIEHSSTYSANNIKLPNDYNYKITYSINEQIYTYKGIIKNSKISLIDPRFNITLEIEKTSSGININQYTDPYCTFHITEVKIYKLESKALSNKNKELQYPIVSDTFIPEFKDINSGIDSIKKVYYGNNLFQILDNQGYLYYSYDGNTFEYNPNITRVLDIAYYNNIWVLVKEEYIEYNRFRKNIYYSEDGINWTVNLSSLYLASEYSSSLLDKYSVSNTYNYITFQNDLWVLYSGNSIIHSVDGKHWGEYTGFTGSGLIDKILGIGNDTWIVTASKTLYLSNDLTTWTDVLTLTGTESVETIDCHNNQIVLITDTSIYSSTDGNIWTKAYTPQLSGYSNGTYKLLYNDNYKSWLFCWDRMKEKVLYSKDGVSWYTTNYKFQTANYSSSYYINNKYFIFQNTTICTSDNGLDWNTYPNTYKVSKVAGNDKVLIGSSGSQVYLSQSLFVNATPTKLSNPEIIGGTIDSKRSLLITKNSLYLGDLTLTDYTYLPRDIGTINNLINRNNSTYILTSKGCFIMDDNDTYFSRVLEHLNINWYTSVYREIPHEEHPNSLVRVNAKFVGTTSGLYCTNGNNSFDDANAVWSRDTEIPETVCYTYCLTPTYMLVATAQGLYRQDFKYSNYYTPRWSKQNDLKLKKIIAIKDTLIGCTDYETYISYDKGDSWNYLSIPNYTDAKIFNNSLLILCTKNGIYYIDNIFDAVTHIATLSNITYNIQYCYDYEGILLADDSLYSRDGKTWLRYSNYSICGPFIYRPDGIIARNRSTQKLCLYQKISLGKTGLSDTNNFITFKDKCIAFTPNGVKYSEDGINWRLAYSPTTLYTDSLRGIYCNNTLTLCNSNTLSVSYDGINWEKIVTNISLNHAIFMGVWVGISGTNLYYATLLTDWKKINTITGCNWVTYANGLGQVCTNSGVYYSQDGVNWTLSSLQVKAYRCEYLNNIWVAVTYSGIYYSEDGKQWTQGLQKTLDYSWNSSTYPPPIIEYANNQYTILLPSNTNRYYYKSIDGKDWSQSYNYDVLYGVIPTNTTTIVAASEHNIRISKNQHYYTFKILDHASYMSGSVRRFIPIHYYKGIILLGNRYLKLDTLPHYKEVY